MRPSELCELETIVALLEGAHKENEACNDSVRTGLPLRPEHLEGCLTNDIKHEADKAVVGCERKQDLVHENNMLEIIYYTLPVEKVHSGPKKIPIERSGESQVLRLAGYIGDSDDFFERHDLNPSDDENDVKMSRQHRGEEAGYHYHRPYCSCDEILLLLLVF